MKQLSPVLYVSYYYSLRAWIYSLVSYTFSIQIYYKFSSSLTPHSMSWTVNLCIYLCGYTAHIISSKFLCALSKSNSLKSLPYIMDYSMPYYLLTRHSALCYPVKEPHYALWGSALSVLSHYSTLERLWFDSTFVLMAYSLRLFHKNILVMWR